MQDGKLTRGMESHMYWSSGNKVLLVSDGCGPQLKRWFGGALIEFLIDDL